MGAWKAVYVFLDFCVNDVCSAYSYLFGNLFQDVLKFVSCLKFNVLNHNTIFRYHFYIFCILYMSVCMPAIFNQWPMMRHNGFLFLCFTLLLWTIQKEQNGLTESGFEVKRPGKDWKNSEKQQKCLEAKWIAKPFHGASKWMHATGWWW